MAPRTTATSTGLVLCPHCSRYVSRQTVWRHRREFETTAALNANIDLPPEPLQLPPLSPQLPLLPLSSSPPAADISITSTELALSDLHLSEVDSRDGDFAIPDVVADLQEPQEAIGDRDDGDMSMLELSQIYEAIQIDDDTDNELNVAINTGHDAHPLQGGGEGPVAGVSGGEEEGFDWEGLPPLIQLELRGYGNASHDHAIVDIAQDTVPSPTNISTTTHSTTSTTHSTTSTAPSASTIDSSPLPELVLLWDLQAARNRTSESIPSTSMTWTAIKTYKLQMEVNLGANAYQKIRATYDNLSLPSLKSLRREMRDLSGLEPELYDCCRNSCMCFVGPYANLQECTYCDSPRFKPNGFPFNQFHYVPLIPQIKALYASKSSAAAMRYRSAHEFKNYHQPDHPIEDIYDSHLYHDLRTSNIEVNGRKLHHHYLDDPRDVLLTALTDGFQLFRRGKHTAWPLLFINNNLSPQVRYQKANCLCAGLIPGPRKPKDHDSFTYVVVQELVRSAIGVDAYDAYDDEMFKLRVFSPWSCGDMPAVTAAYSGGKHHGSSHPCRFCPIEGVRIKNSSNLNYYIPISRPDDYPPLPYNLSTLPLRTHSEWMRQAKEVDTAPNQPEQRRLSQLYGINRTAITSKIPGFQFPWSTPFDFMHLLENTIKNYINLACGEFKGLDAGIEAYILPDDDWEQIGKITLESNKTVPSAFGRRLPNIAEDRTYMTAEAHVVWATLYAPILLRDRFLDEQYYAHWMEFVGIIQDCLAFRSTSESRELLRQRIHKWYSEYERIFYQRDPARLSVCILTTHAWIHLPDIIACSGPLWAYWCWVMERFCGELSRAVTSRKWPYASLNRRVLEIGTLHTLRHLYSLEERLPTYTAMYRNLNLPSYRNETEYPDLTLLHPRTFLEIANNAASDLPPLRRRIARYLVTQYNITLPQASSCIPDIVEQWGRVALDDSDTINSLIGYTRKEENARDATFIQYELLVDRNARFPRRAPEFVGETFFGQLERIILLPLTRRSAELLGENLSSLILLDVHKCDAEEDRYGIWEYERFRYREIINGSSLRALVGRISDRGKWAFVRRSGGIEHADFVD